MTCGRSVTCGEARALASHYRSGETGIATAAPFASSASQGAGSSLVSPSASPRALASRISLAS
jgi:hypothetical protein